MSEHPPDEPGIADWRYEVAHGDTLLGYEAWLDKKEEIIHPYTGERLRRNRAGDWVPMDPARPASISDHIATPDWETSTAFDLCKTCGWPVELGSEGWVHEDKNPAQWTDRRKINELLEDFDSLHQEYKKEAGRLDSPGELKFALSAILGIYRALKTLLYRTNLEQEVAGNNALDEVIQKIENLMLEIHQDFGLE